MEDSKNSKPRAVLYARVSTEEQREGQTIQSQIGELERFIQDKAWTLVGVYKDEGWSGSVLARPELDRLRDDAARGLFECVLINDVDRLARDVTHLGVIKRDLEKQGLRVVFRKLPGDQSPAHNLLVNILGSFAEFERELIADRTRRGKRHKVETRQQFVGCLPPYGFRYLPKGQIHPAGKLEVRTEEAEVVRRMYRWVSTEGLSAAKVVARLNHIGVRPRKGGKLWQKSSVLRVLRSEVYAGVWYYNKHQVCEPKRHTTSQQYRRHLRGSLRIRPRADWIRVDLPESLRILDPAVWRQVQGRLDRNVAFSPRNTKHAYFLKGLVRCGGCRGAYVGDPSHGKFAYRCSKRCQKSPSIKDKYLDETVWNALSEAILNPNLILDAVTAINSRSKVMGTDREMSNQSLNQIETEESQLLQSYRIGSLSPEQLTQELQSLRLRREQLQTASPQENEIAVPAKPFLRRSLEEYCHAIAKKLEILDWQQRQQVTRSLVRRVVFNGEQVKITGILPLSSASGRVETTAFWNYGRNESELTNLRTSVENDDAVEVSFELAAKIQRTLVAVTATHEGQQR
jgi:site-specific DNA recombinase